jgi:hypothetical protein
VKGGEIVVLTGQSQLAPGTRVAMSAGNSAPGDKIQAGRSNKYFNTIHSPPDRDLAVDGGGIAGGARRVLATGCYDARVLEE